MGIKSIPAYSVETRSSFIPKRFLKDDKREPLFKELTTAYKKIENRALSFARSRQMLKTQRT